MILAQLGADVVKVEHPAGGAPFRKTTGGTFGPNYVAYKGIQLDLNHATGRRELLLLVEQTDILIENFVSGFNAGLHKAEELLRPQSEALDNFR